ncbi:MAG: DegV family protein [Tenericutes bacterium]|nr:DegV family protein [Mycoplasmatota bacterium]
MEKIGILIDSTSITRDDLAKFEFVKVAQLQVEIDNVTYKENQLTDEQMIKYIDEGKHFLTSQPAPSDFFNLYKEFADEGYTHVIAIVISHKLSGTYQSAMIAKSMVDFDIEISVHSAIVASYGLALGLEKLAQYVKAGAKHSDVIKKYEIVFKEPLVLFTLGDLKNLLRGGRLSKVQAFVGKILRVKPIIEMIDGKLELVRKERTNAGCIKHFLEKIDYYSKKYKTVYLDIVNINMDELTQTLIKTVKEKYKEIEIHITETLSPVFYSHLGSRGFGIGIVTE